MAYFVYGACVEKCTIGGRGPGWTAARISLRSVERGRKERTSEIDQNARDVEDVGRVADRPVVHLDLLLPARCSARKVEEDVDR